MDSILKPEQENFLQWFFDVQNFDKKGAPMKKTILIGFTLALCQVGFAKDQELSSVLELKGSEIKSELSQISKYHHLSKKSAQALIDDSLKVQSRIETICRLDADAQGDSSKSGKSQFLNQCLAFQLTSWNQFLREGVRNNSENLKNSFQLIN